MSAARKYFGNLYRFTKAILLLFFVCFSDVLLGARTFYFRDFSLFGYPLAAHLHDRFWSGQFPLWNPYNNCGIPFLAEWNTLALYPGSLFYELLPLPWSVNVFCIAHLILGGFGMRRLIHRWTANQSAADISGLLFAFNGLALNCLMWPNNSAAWGWMPWLILAATVGRTGVSPVPLGVSPSDVTPATLEVHPNRAFLKITLAGNRRALARLALTGAMQLLTGAPEIILFTWFVAALLAGWRRWWFVGAGGLLAAALASPQLLPFIELFLQSHRAGGEFATADWALSIQSLGHLIAPLLGATPTPQGVYLQDAQKWTSSFYVGTTTLALAATACKKGRPAILLCIALGSLALACGALPTGFFRYPVKWVVPAVFALTALAGLGVAALNLGRDSASCDEESAHPREAVPEKRREAPHSKSPQINPERSSRFAAIWSAALRAAFKSAQPPNNSINSQSFTSSAPLRRLVIAAAIITLSIAIILFTPTASAQAIPNALIRIAFLWAAVWLLKKRAILLLFAVLALDLATHMPWQNPTVPANLLALSSPIPTARASTPSNPQTAPARSFLTLEGYDELRSQMLPDAAQDLRIRRDALLQNLNLIDGVAKLDGFFSLYPMREREFRKALYLSDPREIQPALDFLGVSRITRPGNVLAWDDRPAALPLVTSGQAPAFAREGQILRQVLNPNFRPLETVYIHDRVNEAQPITARKIPPFATLQSWSPEHLQIQAANQQPAMIVIAQSYDPNWKATAVAKNGNPITLRTMRANYNFIGIETPVTNGLITLDYSPRQFTYGLILACTTFFGMLILLGGKAKFSVGVKLDQENN